MTIGLVAVVAIIGSGGTAVPVLVGGGLVAFIGGAGSGAIRHTEDPVGSGLLASVNVMSIGSRLLATGALSPTPDYPVTKFVTGGDGNLYPGGNGFVGNPETVTLSAGTDIIRYGGEGGRFVTDPGVSRNAISLPPYYDGPWNNPGTRYSVGEGGLDVQQGMASEVFWPKYVPGRHGEGGGRQYYLPGSIGSLLESGKLYKK